MSSITYTSEQLNVADAVLTVLLGGRARLESLTALTTAPPALDDIGSLLDDSAPIEAVMTGYAGSGKSTLLLYLLDKIEEQGHKVYLMAYTWKAARRAGRVTKRPASSIHRFAYSPPNRDEAEGDGWATPDRGKLRFTLRRRQEYDNIAAGSVIVVDEASMVPEREARALRQIARWRNLRILWVGDPAQLPPVSQGDPDDAPGVELRKPTGHLTQVHRQAADKPVIRFCTHVRSGKSVYSFPWNPAHKDVLWRFPEPGGGRVTLNTCVSAWLKREDPSWNPEEDADVVMIVYRNLDRRLLNRLTQSARLRKADLNLPEHAREHANMCASRDGAQMPPVICVGDRIVAVSNGSMFNGDLGVVIGIAPVIKSELEAAAASFEPDWVGEREDYLEREERREMAALTPEELAAAKAAEEAARAAEYAADYAPLCQMVVHGPVGVVSLMLAGRAETHEGLTFFMPRPPLKGEARELEEGFGIVLDRPPELGYALTCHKMQGSAAKAVLVVEPRWVMPKEPEERARWIYTACTRAVDELKLLTCEDLC